MSKVASKRRILIVEDEMMILLLMEEILSDAGFACATAANVEQALALVKAETFDGATLDVNLNGDKSYPLADVLAASGVPFLFVTGYGRRGLNEHYRGWPILNKPFHCDTLVEMVRRLVPEAGGDAGTRSDNVAEALNRR